MKVSVVIPTYNRARMVAQAVKAALAQTRPPDEIVISDDASSDATWSTLEALADRDPRVRIFRRERNSGGVENWNFSLHQAGGDLIAICTDDDRWLPEHLQQSLDYLEAHPEVGMVHAGFVDAAETESGAQLTERRLRAAVPLIVNRRNLLWYMTRYFDWPFHPSTLVLRRAVWTETGEFDPGFALADTDWFMRVVERFEIALLPLHGVINRRHRGNWSNRLGSAHMQREIFEIVERAIARRRWGMRGMWRCIWRANVRLRLLLTIRARVRSGHADAACAAWSGLAGGTGRKLPNWLARLGESIIRSRCAGRDGHFEDPRESVSPL